MAHPSVLEIDDPPGTEQSKSRRFISRAPSPPGGLWLEGAHGTAVRTLIEDGLLRPGDWWVSIAHSGLIRTQVDRASKLDLKCALVISARIPLEETRIAREVGCRTFLGSAHSFSRDGFIPKYRWYSEGELVILTRRLETLLAATVTLQNEAPGRNFFISERPDPLN